MPSKTVKMKASNAIFASLSPYIIEISRLSGIPGVSLGVIDHGNIIHQASYGYGDLENKIPCDSESNLILGSLTKAFTSALLAELVAEGKLNRTTSLNQILPGFERYLIDLSSSVTVADLLSHCTGLSAFDSIWLGSNNEPLLDYSDSVKILSYVPQQRPFRGPSVYNNFAYDALAHVIEKVSGSSYSEFLHDRIVQPLGMKRTYYTAAAGQMGNEAKPYAALEDSSSVQTPAPLQDRDVLMGSVGGIRSCVTDMLAWSSALMDAAAKEMGFNPLSERANKHPAPFLSQVPNMWTA